MTDSKIFKRNIVIVLSGMAGCFGCIRYQFHTIFGPGRTMQKTAYILVHDSKLGMRAKQKAIEHGEAILPLIQKESEDF